MDGYKQYQKVIAVFTPKRTDDLQESLETYIGKKFEFMAAWIIEDGTYAGQWAFTGDMQFSPEWVPECDLDIVPQEV